MAKTESETVKGKVGLINKNDKNVYRYINKLKLMSSVSFFALTWRNYHFYFAFFCHEGHEGHDSDDCCFCRLLYMYLQKYEK